MALLKKILEKFATSILIPHFNAFARQLNPIQPHEQLNNQKASQINEHFLFSFLNFITIFIYGNLALEYESTGTINWWGLPQSPYILMHQMYLPVMWPLTDPSLLVSEIVHCFLY